MRGVPLPQIWDIGRHARRARRNRLKEPLGVITAIRQAIRNLRGETVNASTLDGDGFEEAAFARELAHYGSRHFAHMRSSSRWWRCFMGGDAAIEMASRSAFLKDSPGMLHVADHYFYQALAYVRRAVAAHRCPGTPDAPENGQPGAPTISCTS